MACICYSDVTLNACRTLLLGSFGYGDIFGNKNEIIACYCIAFNGGKILNQCECCRLQLYNTSQCIGHGFAHLADHTPD